MNTYAVGVVSGFAGKLSFETNLVSFVEFFEFFVLESLNKVAGKRSFLGKILSFVKKISSVFEFFEFFSC